MRTKTIITFLAIALSALQTQAQTVVRADESPFGFEPLAMYNFPSREFPITKYGAKAGDVKANTAAIAKAMEACNKAGGGHVVIPAGDWLTGPVHFRSNCNLSLKEGARLLFEDDPRLYLPAVQTTWEGVECFNWSPLIYAFECHNVGISGPGTVEAKMDTWKKWFGRPEAHMTGTRQLYAMGSTDIPVKYRHMEENDIHMRPHFIQFNRCVNVHLDHFKIINSPFWTTHLFLCRDVWVDGIDSSAHGHNNDGIDIEMTQHILVENCKFDQADDGVVLKAGRNRDAWRLNTPTKDVVIRNCDAVMAHGLLVVGSEISGGVCNVYMHDCRLLADAIRLMYIKTNIRRGAVLENIMMEKCEGMRTKHVFEIATDVLYQWKDIVPTFEEKPTVIRNISMKDVESCWCEGVYLIQGDSREPVRNVSITNLHVKEATKFISRCENVYDLQVSGLTVDNYSKSGKSHDFNGGYR